MGSVSGKAPFNEKIFNDITSSGGNFIGSGAFGEVYGPCIWEYKTIAIKKRMFSKDTNDDNPELRKILGACEKWKSLRHRNLISIYKISFDSPALYTLMEFAEGGSLKEVLKLCKSDLTSAIQMNWSTQIVDGMAYLHRKEILHRDLKSANIFIMEKDESVNVIDKTIKITDFDQIREQDHSKGTSTCVGTYQWMAPEVLNDSTTFLKTSDVWSYGVVLWEILTRKIPHQGRGYAAMYEISQKKIKLEIQDSCPEIIKKILIRCLHYEQSYRPSFDEIQRLLQNPSDDQLLKAWAEDETTKPSSEYSAITLKVEMNTTANTRSKEEANEETVKEETNEETIIQERNEKRHKEVMLSTCILGICCCIGSSHRRTPTSQGQNQVEQPEELHLSPTGKPPDDVTHSQLESSAFFALPNITDVVDALTSNRFFVDRETSGTIYGPFRWKNKNCILKQILYNSSKLTEENKQEILLHINRCRELDHPNLVKVFEVWFLSPALNILMEYAEGRSLDTFLRPRDASYPLKPLPLEIIADWALQIADGMRYLHGKKRFHRNLKAANIVIMDSPETLKIGSYTLAEENDHSAGVMSMAWMAPEYIRGDQFSMQSDVWSYGVTIWEILTRDVPYQEMRKETELVRAAINKTLELKIPDSCPELLRDLLRRCLRYDKSSRPSFDEIQRVLQNPPDGQLLKQWAEENATSSKLSAIKLKDEINMETNEEAIIRHRQFLEERMDPDFGLLNTLLANATLSWIEVSEVKDKSPFYKRNSKLLDYILEKNQYSALFAALGGNAQSHIVNYLNANGEYSPEYEAEWPLTPDEISALDTDRNTLIAKLDLSYLLGHLYSSKVINMMQMNFVSDSENSNYELIEILRRRSRRDFQETIHCLRLTKQSHVAAILLKCGGGSATIKKFVE